MSLSNQDREEIATTIRLVVNGNIKRVEEKLDAHIERHDELVQLSTQMIADLKPVVEGVRWINTTKTMVMYVAGFAVAFGSIFTLTK